jgi:hypothetical protein
VLETRDLDLASELISEHPGLQFGRWEIRPVGDLSAMVEESRRRGKYGGTSQCAVCCCFHIFQEMQRAKITIRHRPLEGSQATRLR